MTTLYTGRFVEHGAIRMGAEPFGKSKRARRTRLVVWEGRETRASSAGVDAEDAEGRTRTFRGDCAAIEWLLEGR